MKNKKIVKKLRLKESVKNTLVIITGMAIITTVFVNIASNRIKGIEKNKEAYTNRSVPVNVHPIFNR